MKKKSLAETVEEVSTIIDQLNSLSYRDSAEDILIASHLEKLDEIHDELSGVPPLSKKKTSVYLQ